MAILRLMNQGGPTRLLMRDKLILLPWPWSGCFHQRVLVSLHDARIKEGRPHAGLKDLREAVVLRP